MQLAEHTTGSIKIWSDSSYVVAGFVQRRRRARGGPNADLWHELVQALNQRGGHFRIFKVRAHLDAEAVTHGLNSLRAWIGNCFADAFAELAASEVQLERPIVAQYQLATDTIWRVQKRNL